MGAKLSVLRHASVELELSQSWRLRSRSLRFWAIPGIRTYRL